MAAMSLFNKWESLASNEKTVLFSLREVQATKKKGRTHYTWAYGLWLDSQLTDKNEETWMWIVILNKPHYAGVEYFDNNGWS